MSSLYGDAAARGVYSQAPPGADRVSPRQQEVFDPRTCDIRARYTRPSVRVRDAHSGNYDSQERSTRSTFAGPTPLRT